MRENTITVNSAAELREIIRSKAGDGKMLTITIEAAPPSEGNEVVNIPADEMLQGDSHTLEGTDGEADYGDKESFGFDGGSSCSDTACKAAFLKHGTGEGDRADG